MRKITLNAPTNHSHVIAARHSHRIVCRSLVAPSPQNSLARPVEAATARQDFASVLGLVQWAVANKIRFTGCRPDIRNGVRGIYATGDCNAGDILVAVPLQSCLVVLPDERCPFPEFLPQDVWAGFPWYGQLACKLLHERCLGPASRFADYLPALPASVDLPVLWPPEHVRLLQYPYLEQQILDEQAEWGRLYDTVRRHLDRHGLTRADMFLALACVRSRTFEGPHLPTPPLVKLLAGVAAAAAVAVAAAAIPTGGSIAASDPAGLLTAFLPSALAALGIPTFWQMAEARRAASAEPGTVLYAISPFIDMFNHDSRAKSECVFNPGRNEFRVAAGEPLQRAQQVLISYGNQSNDALLQRYGFVQLDGNLHDRYVVQDMLRLLERALDRYMAVPAQEVREAALALDLPTGSLDQVILTAAGPPQQAVEAVTHLLAVLAARLPNSPHGELPSAKALVSIACTEAERAAASSLQEDEAALTQLAKWEAWEEEMTALAADSLRQPFADGAAALVDAVTSEETSAQLEVKALEGVSTFAGAVDGQEIVNQEAAAVEGGRIGESDRISSVKPLPVVSRQQFLPPSELAAFGANVERYRTVLMFRIAKKRVLRSVASDR